MLALRVLTLTPEEMRQVAAWDQKGAALLQRTRSLAEKQMADLHGAVRSFRPLPDGVDDLACDEGMAAIQPWNPDRRSLECVHSGPFEIRAGDRVLLRPQRRADIMDIALEGKTAIVRSIEQDFEDRIHLAVVLEGDPGADLGPAAQLGHRFFFGPEEVERLPAEPVEPPCLEARAPNPSESFEP